MENRKNGKNGKNGIFRNNKKKNTFKYSLHN